jgi:hypothetical protein
MTTDATESYWVLWINRETGDTSSVFYSDVERAWEFANTVNETQGTNFQAFVVGKR